jgi:hypothetical protein
MYEQCLYCCYTFHSRTRVCINSVCIAVIYFSHSRVCMNSVCIALIYFSHSSVCMNSVCIADLYFRHSKVCMNSVCIAVIHFTVTVVYVWTVFVLLLYISQSRYGMYEQCVYCCYAFHSHSRVCMNNVCIAVLHFTVTVGHVRTMFVLPLYISQSQ